MELKGKYTNAVIHALTIEDSCLNQIQSMINSPAFNKQVVIMPDTHAGSGSVVGFTMPVGLNLIPNTIGVDIGCGIYAYKVKGLTTDNWEDIDKKIRSVIPLGFNHRTDATETIEWVENKMGCQGRLRGLINKLGLTEQKVINQLRTLGGGNHFIEFAKSTKDDSYWLLIHTGSRNVGKTTCEYHQKRAIDYVNNIRKQMMSIVAIVDENDRQSFKENIKSHDIFKVPNEQCWLEGLQKDEYLQDMFIAQKFAHLNKRMIKDKICEVLHLEVEESIESVHNYIDPKDNIIRKGAIRAYKDEKVVIPFNMRDGSILATGKGSPGWNFSAPHGAGRIMSRGVAQKTLQLNDFKETMKNVWSSSVNSATLDESPFAYKPKSEIEEAIKDCVDVYDYLKPVYNLKESNFTGKYEKLRNK
jgi:tRNA-splicing ligase RtcB